jgi:WD40 repeat protein
MRTPSSRSCEIVSWRDSPERDSPHLAAGKVRASLPTRPAGITAVAFSPDGRTLAAATDHLAHGGPTSELWLIDVRAGRLREVAVRAPFVTRGLAFSPDGKRLAFQRAPDVVILDLETGRLTHLPGHAQAVNRLAFAPDGKTLATAGQDGRERLRNPVGGAELHSLEGGAAWVEHLAWGGGAKLLASAAGRKLRLWDASGRLVRAYPDQPSTVAALRWRPKSRELAAAGYGGIAVFDPDLDVPKARLEHKGPVLTVEWSPDGKMIAAGNQDATVKFWVLRKGTPLQMAGYPITFLILLVVSMAGFGILLRIVNYYFLYPTFYPVGMQIPLFFPPKILIAIFVTYSLVAIVASFHLIKHYYKHQQASQLLQQIAQQLEKDKLAAELKLLKSQINPHFLFNTLNNLYVLTLNNSSNAPLMVHKLSELMSYMLYDSNQAEVPLEKEIQYIRNYIDLEKIRYGDRLEVSFNIYGNIQGIMIAPLLILPFVENGFKHGARNQLHHSWIQIDIESDDRSVIVKVENSKPVFQEESKVTSGVGLNNVKRRLDHLYPDRYSLQMFNEQDTYMVILKVALTEPVASYYSKEISLS